MITRLGLTEKRPLTMVRVELQPSIPLVLLHQLETIVVDEDIASSTLSGVCLHCLLDRLD